jgi:hypothetical protein
MAFARSCVFSATDASPGWYIVVVCNAHGWASLRLRQLRSTVLYMRLSSGVTYKCVSSKIVQVSRPPSFDAPADVDGRISPPPGMNVRVSPAAPAGSPSASFPWLRLKWMLS